MRVIIDTLDKHGVTYLVIGGFAVELYGVPVPPTRDVDITPAPDPSNLVRLSAALGELGARLRVPGGSREGVAVPGGLTVEFLQSMITLTLVTSAGPLDISVIPDGTGGYEDLAARQQRILYDNRRIPVASLEDVIRSKEAAGREKDLLVLPALREHLRRRRS